MKGAAIVFFLKLLELQYLGFNSMKSQKKLYAKYILLEATKVHLRVCIYVEDTTISFFLKFL